MAKLKLPKRPKPKNELERASMTGGGKTPAQLSKEYATKRLELKKIISTSKSATLVAAAKKALAAVNKKAAGESGKITRKMEAGRKLPKGKREPSKPAMPFNKGGMPKKSHAKPGSYSKAYMMGGMAKKPKGKK